MERIHHGHGVGELFSGGGLEAGEPVHRDDLDPLRPVRRARGEPLLEHLLRAALDHVQQPCRPRLLTHGVRSMITVTYLSPRRVCRQTCSSTPIVVTRSNLLGSSISRLLPSAMTAAFAVCHDTPSTAAARETVRWSTTIAVSAHSIPPREIFALGAAALLVSWRHIRRQCAHR